jgi:hypothetical protein
MLYISSENFNNSNFQVDSYEWLSKEFSLEL